MLATLLIFPLAASGQKAVEASIRDALPLAGVERVRQSPELSKARISFNFEKSSQRRMVRSIILGAIVGGALGAIVGNQVGGGQRSCPTSPAYACTKPAFGTLGGAVAGAIIGGVFGGVIDSRQKRQ